MNPVFESREIASPSSLPFYRPLVATFLLSRPLVAKFFYNRPLFFSKRHRIRIPSSSTLSPTFGASPTRNLLPLSSSSTSVLSEWITVNHPIIDPMRKPSQNFGNCSTNRKFYSKLVAYSKPKSPPYCDTSLPPLFRSLLPISKSLSTFFLFDLLGAPSKVLRPFPGRQRPVPPVLSGSVGLHHCLEKYSSL